MFRRRNARTAHAATEFHSADNQNRRAYNNRVNSQIHGDPG
jgi:hypothetical protein